MTDGRTCLPDRRRSWRQKVRLAGHSFYLTCGEYPNGVLGEIFIDAAKAGTFSRGILDALARVVSLALQSGVPVERLVKALAGLNFPPAGKVEGSAAVASATSLADWLAQELAAAYHPGDNGKETPC